MTAKGQNKCPTRTVYRTDNIGEVKDSVLLKLPLYFEVSKDSIIASIGTKGNEALFEFKIISRDCQWNDNTTIGKTVFKVSESDGKTERQAILIIDFTDLSKRYISTEWENGQTRYFSIAKKYDE